MPSPNKPHPETGVMISYSRWKQLMNLSEGKCARCCARPVEGRTMCQRHLTYHRKRHWDKGTQPKQSAWSENRPSFDGVNWNKTNHQLSRELGCSVTSVFNMRKKLGIPGRAKGSPPKDNLFYGVIWDAPDHVIAKRLGVSLSMVWNYREKNRIPGHGERTKLS